MRPSWDDYFYKITNDVAERSTCTRRKVGAIITKDKRILATGYNGVPTGIEHCAVRGCLREQLGVPSGEKHELCRGLHAEQNAVIQAAKHGVVIDGGVLYCTNQPCVVCSKIIINSGIEEIVFFDGYPDALAEEMLVEAGIKVRAFQPE
ncbi:cytidine deaminase [Actinomycetota bacterium]|nr:cytidine deaminase [Actinomycetota bacterium]